ncbi:MAG: F0F1 ATP synthase subunit delta [Patescibacteria group bacterium]|nr:F0F1 ATP synthase subunit delta [Patescibacteria group bacterium]
MAKISAKNIAEAIYIASEGKHGNDLSIILKNGAKMISNKRMIGHSENILKALQDIIDKKNNTIRANITSAKPLTNEQRKNLEHQIKEKYKAERVESVFFEKSELLGGIRIEVGDEVTDSTYKNKLSKLENFLIRNN